MSTGAMVSGRAAWCLERDDGPTRFASEGGISVFSEPSARSTTAHDCPAWKVVVPLRGTTIGVAGGRGDLTTTAGVVVPPGARQACAADGPYVAVFVDGWLAHRPPDATVTSLDRGVARRIVAALGPDDLDLAAARPEVAAALGGFPPTDRLSDALARLAAADADPVSDQLGLSPSHVRALVRARTGSPLGRLRRWARLVDAVGRLPSESLAVVAHASGFADQPHLTRVASTMVGRPPGSVLRGAS